MQVQSHVASSPGNSQFFNAARWEWLEDEAKSHALDSTVMIFNNMYRSNTNSYRLLEQ